LVILTFLRFRFIVPWHKTGDIIVFMFQNWQYIYINKNIKTIMSSFVSRYGCKTCDMSYLTKSLVKHENMYFWYPTMMIFSSDTNVIDTYFYQWVFSHRVPVVKQVLFHLFAFKLYLKVYLSVLFLQGCVSVLWISMTYPLKFWQRYSPIYPNLICWQPLILFVINGTRLPFQGLCGKQLT
jgi:hypothetical protein